MGTRLFKRVSILVVVIASLLVGTSALAQGPFGSAGNPLDAVLAKLDQIIETLTAPPPTASGPVLLTTPLLWYSYTDVYGCFAANVGTETIARIDVRWVNAVGVAVSSAVTPNLLPGHTRASYLTAVTAHLRCEFSFEGAAAAVRGNLVVLDGGTSQTLVSVDAR